MGQHLPFALQEVALGRHYYCHSTANVITFLAPPASDDDLDERPIVGCNFQRSSDLD
jgi:hypothetical protein